MDGDARGGAALSIKAAQVRQLSLPVLAKKWMV